MKYTRIAHYSIAYAPLLSSNQQITKSVCFLHAKKKAHSSCPLWYRADALEMFMRILFAIIRDQFISLTQISQISRNIRRYRLYVTSGCKHSARPTSAGEATRLLRDLRDLRETQSFVRGYSGASCPLWCDAMGVTLS